MQRPNMDVAGRSGDSEQQQQQQQSNLKKQRMMQQQLAILLHAKKCRSESRTVSATPCTVKYCERMRHVWAHIHTCQLDADCRVPFCHSSKHILIHFDKCIEPACPVCPTVRKSSAQLKAKTPIHPNHSALNISEYHNGPLLATDCKSDGSLLNGVKSAGPSPSYIPSATQSCASNCQVVNGAGGVDANRTTTGRTNYLSDQDRENAIKKFVHTFLSILTTNNSLTCNDPYIRQFLDHVKWIERDAFMKSKSAEEYYAQLSKRQENVLVEFDEKRKLQANRLVDPTNCDTTSNHSSSSSMGHSQSEREASQSNFTVTCNIPTSTSTNCELDQKFKIEPKLEEPSTTGDMKLENMAFQTGTVQVEVKAEEPSTPLSDPLIPSKVDDSSATNENHISREVSSPTQPASYNTSNQPIKSWGPEDTTTTPPVPARTPPHREPSVRMTWYPNELLRLFMPVVEKISKEHYAEPFLQPVDWEALEIYDYPKVVSHPMDLSTIRKKLEDRLYKEPWDVVNDFWLMLNNAWLYNKKTSKVYKNCTKLAEIFETLIDPVVQQMGFCCGREYYYLPPPLTCSTPKFCTIHRDSIYYVYQNEENKPGMLEQKYMVCERCYNESGDEIRLEIESSVLVTVQKSRLEKCKNDLKEKEPFVFCKKCGRKWHRVCAIHSDDVWPEGFVCKQCLKDHTLKRPENRFTARRLPTCQLSNFLEKRVNDFLKKKEVNTGDVIVRVLASADKSVEVKPGMKTRYCENGELPESFPYRVKAIFAFQEIEGQEVCFFGLHVQEYGSECVEPNKRRVYLAYLDSVYFFRPKEYRTDIYHELLVGYIHYAKLLGYVFAHIWACPPSEGDDYIFHMHPPDQKIPKPKRLQEWYQKMLRKAHSERIVVDYKDIYQDACESHFYSPAQLAYFEGDFWPNTLEELFKEIDEEDARRKREQEAMAQDNDEEDDSKDSVEARGEHDKAAGKKKAKKRKLKRSSSMSVTGKRKRLGGGSGDLVKELAKKLYETMEKHKENFFVIRLHPQNNVASLKDIEDPDPLISSDLMECRGAFLERAREKHLEFSSLRRAKYSTLVMLYDLHNETRQPLYTCNECNAQLEIRWHCRQCGEYDLCPQCYSTTKHPHPLVQVGSSTDDGRGSHDMGRDASAVQESDRDKISRLVKALGHGSSCRDANCRFYGCKNIKDKVRHFREHMAGRNQCALCRSLSVLSYYHSKTCHELKCLVPLCPKLKAKMKQQQKQQRLEQTQMLRRRMATMQRYNTTTPSHQPTPPSQSSVNPPSAAISESAPSPAPTTVGSSSPYATVTSQVTTPSFTAQPSPLSRTNSSSLMSQQQSPYYNPTIAGACPPRQLVPSSSNMSSPSLTSPQHTSSNLPTSPYSCPNQLPYGYMDTQESNTCSSHIPYQTLPKSQSVVALPGSTSNQPRFHQLERSHSAQFSVSPNPTTFMRHSPGSSTCQQYVGVNVASPTSQPQQVYSNTSGLIISNPSDTFIQQHQGMSSLQRSNSECQQQQPPYTKHTRHAQSMVLGTTSDNPSIPMNPTQFLPGMNNSSWRPSQSTTPTTPGSSSNPYANPCMSNRAPDGLYMRTVPVSATFSARNCLSSSATAGGGITLEDIQLVRQTYADMGQRGISQSEFFNWLNANPNLQRAWQYLEQVHLSNNNNLQQPPQPPSTMLQQSTNYTVAHPTNNPLIRGATPPTRYSTTTMQPGPPMPGQPSQQQQQWAAVQMQQYSRFRSTNPATARGPPPTQQSQFAYYTQSSKLGNPSGTLTTTHPPVPPRHMNPVSNTMAGLHSSYINNPSMVIPGGGAGTASMVGRGFPAQPNSQHIRLGAPATLGNLSSGPVNTNMRSTPPPTQQPQCSPVMLSQLLGPTHTGNIQLPHSQFAPNPSNGSNVPTNRNVMDFPSTTLSSHYPDGGLV